MIVTPIVSLETKSTTTTPAQTQVPVIVIVLPILGGLTLLAIVFGIIVVWRIIKMVYYFVFNF